MQLTKIGREDRLHKGTFESALAGVDLLIGRHGSSKHVLCVLRPRNDSKGKSLAKECLAKPRINVDDAVGKRRHGGISSEVIQALNGTPGRCYGIGKALTRILALCVAEYAGTQQERSR